MSANIYLDFELTLDPAVTDTSGMVRLLNEKIRYWNQHTNFYPRYKLLVVEAEKSIASGLPNLREQAAEARRIKWKELQDKIQIAARAGINEAVAQKLVQRFAAFFTEETVLKELGQYQIRPSVFQPEFNSPPKPESLQCEKPVSFSDMQAIAEDLRFVHGGKYKNLYDLLGLPQTASTEQLYFAATAAADKVDRMPKSHPEADPLNRLSSRFLLYFKDDIYRRGYDVALRRLSFDTLAAEVFDFYAESFRSNQKSDEQLWQESVQKTVALGFTKAEAEYLVYEFYCITRKCPPPTPQASSVPPAPPIPKQNTKRNESQKPKLLLFWILLAAFAVIFIVGAAVLMREKNNRLMPETKVAVLKGESKAGDLLELTIKDVKYRFRWCPAGKFTMGSPSSEKGRFDKGTRHQVTLTQGFWMGETEVTQEQWEGVIGKKWFGFVANNPSYFKGAK
ncbi:MAG: SUMF1/EgtB/PvdO family nonheme iron enzyme, partial [Planctomycetaceae bacterium]|nr:SUMF1/EgtB/PvdO family nonheme iron enzyme [Planctomycetaceae bacterium]